MFRDPIPVTITGGDVITQRGRYWRVPKRDLVASVQVSLQDERLKFAEGMVLAPTLIEEMLRFQVNITDSGHDIYSHREGEHDDLILAVMLACWWAQRPEPSPRPQVLACGPFEGIRREQWKADYLAREYASGEEPTVGQLVQAMVVTLGGTVEKYRQLLLNIDREEARRRATQPES